MQKLLNINIKIYQIDCFTKKTKRIEYIENFKSDKEISLLLNVQILNEGINIPICDSVFITNPNNNIVNLIQRMSRCNRILDNKDNCKIYLWCRDKKIDKIMSYINENTNNEFINKIYKIDFDDLKTRNFLNIYIPTNNYKINIIDYLKIYSHEKLIINDENNKNNNTINFGYNIIKFENHEIIIIVDNEHNIWSFATLQP